MIRPTKYLDLKTCLLNVASVVLLELKQYRVIRLSELDTKVRIAINDHAKFNLIPALNFLFLTGTIEYDVDADSVYLLQKKSD